MDILTAGILLIVLVVFSNIISHYLVSIPTALIEIAVGLLVALIFDIRIDLEADWFMLLFVAPLLFNDALKFPKDELWELRAPIFANAIWLVFLTTLIGGYFVHSLIPTVPLPLAMALIAILSPTDPVAVHGIAESVKLPKKILSLISGESLINDASGLIAFKYALAAFLTGQFSLAHATGNFLYMSLVGALIGFVCITIIHFIRLFLVQQGIQDVVLHTTIQILTPFIIFILADEVAHASGVIAVVTAGVLSINQTPIFRSQYSEIRLVTDKMWDILVYILNGVVFIILGIELPTAMSATLANPAINNIRLIFYIIAIWFVLLIIRVVWSYMYLWLTYRRKENQNTTKPSWNTALLTGLTGVRGAITLATIMSMPFFLPGGEVFEQRSLVIFLACGVVLTSLLVATIALPILTKQRKRLILIGDDSIPNAELHEESLATTEDDSTITEIEARKLMVKHALRVLQKEVQTKENASIMPDIIHEFETRLRHLYREQNDERTNRLYSLIEKEVQEVSIKGEQQAVEEMVETEKVSPKDAETYLKIIQAKHNRSNTGFKSSAKKTIASTKKLLSRIFWKYKTKKVDTAAPLSETPLLKLELRSMKGAIVALRAYRDTIDPTSDGVELKRHLVNQYLHEYLYRLQRLKQFGNRTTADYQKTLNEYYMKALDAERETIQELYQNGRINLTLANQLRQSLNYYESSVLQNNDHD